MLKRFIIAVLMMAEISAFAQVYDPVSWSFGYEKVGENQYELIFTAAVEEGWHIYAMKINEGGPIPTSFRFDSIPGVTFVDKAWEVTKPEEIFDDAFGFKIGTLSGKAEFRQKIKSSAGSFTVKGAVNFMACNNKTCSPPKDAEFNISIGNKDNPAANKADTGNDASSSDLGPGSKGLLAFFLLSVLAGFAGIITPCVFPMIPMTVAFFSRGTENRKKSVINALVFGISIILIYSSLGIIVSLTSAGAGFANTLSTHWIPNLLFFLLFVLFAASFLGAFEIILPNKWISGADSQVDKGGLFSSFFLGLTTVIVSFSCTGPIIGALLVASASGDVIRPTIGMFGFGLAFALPFTLFALFPSVLNKIPKSGGWLNSVKVVLGFLMLALSMKFLMTIDSVYNLKLISRDLYLAVWIVLFTLLGFYLLGKIRFAHDSEIQSVGTFRFFLVIVTFIFVVYLFTGLIGAPLKGISSLLPPQATSWFSSHNMSSSQESASSFMPGNLTSGTICSEPKYSNVFEMPLGLTGYFDYKQGIACAKEKGKPVLLDFKGHACANCKIMEAKVWSDPEVLKRLRENFVIIALYADDRTQLPENEWFVSKIDGKQKKTIGKQNEDLEISLFRTNALPLYVITDYNGTPLNKPMPANLNIQEYKNWLDEGVKLFEK